MRNLKEKLAEIDSASRTNNVEIRRLTRGIRGSYARRRLDARMRRIYALWVARRAMSMRDSSRRRLAVGVAGDRRRVRTRSWRSPRRRWRPTRWRRSSAPATFAAPPNGNNNWRITAPQTLNLSATDDVAVVEVPVLAGRRRDLHRRRRSRRVRRRRPACRCRRRATRRCATARSTARATSRVARPTNTTLERRRRPPARPRSAWRARPAAVPATRC